MQYKALKYNTKISIFGLAIALGYAIATPLAAQAPVIFPDDSAVQSERNAKDTHAISRWTGLPHDRQILVLQALGLKLPQAFYDCVCRSANYGQPGTSQFYHPDTIGTYDPRYSCQHPGPPCIVSGYGCGRHDLPSDPQIFENCGKIEGLEGGNPMDNILSALADRANRKALTGNPVVMRPKPAKEAAPDCKAQRALAGLPPIEKAKDPIPPERKIYAISPQMQEKLENMHLSQATQQKILASLAKALASAPQIIPFGDEQDLRIDMDVAEVGISTDKNGNPYISEFVMKMPELQESDTDFQDWIKWKKPNFEAAITFDPSDQDDAIAGIKPKGYRVGFAWDGKLEAKFGIDLDPSKSAADYYDGEWQKESEYSVVRFFENTLADFDFYFGTAADAVSFEVAGNKLSVGPEVTWKIKDRYSKWLFSDMNDQFDNLLEHQKHWEERRGEMIRREAAKYGVDARCFSTGKTISLTRAAYEKQKQSNPSLGAPFANLTGKSTASGGAR
ncbi:hypothetical protein FAP39_09915 [Shimia litoralis]|uniref:Uncharacterized protein n=1 Tax=Shimia litoralis TaxID=420403 RepID=A0A4U7N4R1_9RHOB|nr:hypothetical protein [Shimia litoralis]TKZ20598.1 hypothetical protein FAP39_09915 [Shimia litoralis]